MGFNPRFPLTQHAKVRLAQHGIDPAALDLLLLWGCDLPAGQGRRRRVLRDTEAVELLSEGKMPVVVEAATRLEAIIGQDNVIVTVYARDPHAVRLQRRAGSSKRARARRR